MAPLAAEGLGNDRVVWDPDDRSGRVTRSGGPFLPVAPRGLSKVREALNYPAGA